MYTIGKLLKKLREDKRISQNKLCGSFISRNSLSKIENDKVLPKFNTLAYILDQLSITFDEFLFLLGEKTNRNTLINQFWKISDNTDFENLKKFIDECDYFLKRKDDFFIEDLQILAKSLLSLPNISTQKISKKIKNDIEPIWYRLNDMNLWTLAELKLASCIIFYYPSEIALNIASRIERELKKYEQYTPVKMFILNSYLNLTTLYMGADNIDLGRKINTCALDLSKELNRYDIYYFCLVRAGIFSKNPNNIDEGLDILSKLNKNNYIEFLNAEIERFT